MCFLDEIQLTKWSMENSALNQYGRKCAEQIKLPHRGNQQKRFKISYDLVVIVKSDHELEPL